MQPEGHHLAELNIGRLLAPTDDPRVAEFMNNLDRINGLGKRMPGFIWLMQGETAGNTDHKIGGDPLLVPNLSVWENYESLKAFVFDTLHKRFMDRKSEWFEVLRQEHFVMWWVPVGQNPTLDEALQRLDMLRENGPSEDAFDWDYLKQMQVVTPDGCEARV